MDRLLAMQAFARVVELGGFTKAAESLRLPKATVSDLVRNLEGHLDARLLHRTTRRVSLTPDGAAFYDRLTQILSDLEEAEGAISQLRVAPKGLLRVDVPGSIGQLVIVPGLPQFLARYPDLRLELGMSLRLVNLVEEGIDCVVRVGPLEDSSLVARRVGTMRFICCASPRYLQEHGTPSIPEDLLISHRCVNVISNRTGKAMEWDFKREGQTMHLAVQGILSVNDPTAYVACGLMGLGIVKVATYLARPYLDSGQLVQVLAAWTAEPVPISVLYPQNRHLSAKVRAFADWIAELFEQNSLLQISQNAIAAQ
jgi:LysR family transcriptional regulator, regulator for bpeEF and oprC